mmetsp:Transcript_67665/g.135924  ORF Transcript_67665/g.135924 Transcript_67665/m.135924 type:complete len:206 (-) Transcript_67665:688-1305(-)
MSFTVCASPGVTPAEHATLLFIGTKQGSAGSGVRMEDCRCNGLGMMPLLGSRTQPGMWSMRVSGGGRGAGHLRSRASATSPPGRATARGAAPMASTPRTPTRHVRTLTRHVHGVDQVDRMKLLTTGAPPAPATATATTTVTTATIAATTASTTATAPTTVTVILAKPRIAATTAGGRTRATRTCRPAAAAFATSTIRRTRSCLAA